MPSYDAVHYFDQVVGLESLVSSLKAENTCLASSNIRVAEEIQVLKTELEENKIRVHNLLSHIEDAKEILGSLDGESLGDALKRVLGIQTINVLAVQESARRAQDARDHEEMRRGFRAEAFNEAKEIASRVASEWANGKNGFPLTPGMNAAEEIFAAIKKLEDAALEPTSTEGNS